LPQNKTNGHLSAELQSLRNEFNDFLDELPDALLEVDVRQGLTHMNLQAQRLFGYTAKDVADGIEIPQLFGKNEYDRAVKIINRYMAESRKRQVEYISLQKQKLYEFVMRKKDGSIFYAETQTSFVLDGKNVPTGLRTIIRNITERKRLQKELAQAQRLEIAGRVAGQIAHDFNNLLSPLTVYPDLIRQELPADHAVLQMLDEMEFSAKTIAAINQQLLALGRQGHYTMEPIDLNDLVQKVVLSQCLPSGLVVREKFASDLFFINGGGAQLARILVNLITNAKEAMNGSGVLTISTENLYLEKPLKGYKIIKRGEYVKLAISDTGPGIEPEILDQIFDPFFSTKKMDKQRGSGLGLSVVHGIVEVHGGYIMVESTLNHGTTFSLYFPITGNKEIAKTVEKVKGGDEKILIVDDDSVQRKVAGQLLKRLGYKIHAVSSGEQAVDYVKEYEPDLLVLDMGLDGIDGTETYRQILEFRPNQRAIILSGYAMSQRVEEALRLGAGAFITKPIALNALAVSVRKELNKVKKTDGSLQKKNRHAKAERTF